MNYAIHGICGGMYSGKTTELLRQLDRAKRAGREVLAVKPALDTRYDPGKICSHAHATGDALVIPSTAQGLELLLESMQSADVLCVDEAQFFPAGILEVALTLQAKKKMVIWAGLDMDYLGKPFGPVPALLAISTHVTKLSAVCHACGEDAHYTHKKMGGREQVAVGGTHEYEARCYACWSTAL